MTPPLGRSAATLLALGGLTALYNGAYKTAVGCSLLAGVALASLKDLRKERPPVKRLMRSQSAPPSIGQNQRGVEMVLLNLPSLPRATDLLFSSAASSPPVETWHTLDLRQLPKRMLSLFELAALSIGKLPSRNPPEIIEHVIDLPQGYRLADFGEYNTCFEIGDVWGAQYRCSPSIIAMNDPVEAQKLGKGGFDLLVLLGDQWRIPGFLPQNYFHQIHYRILESRPEISEEEIEIFARSLVACGRFILIFNRKDQLLLEQYQKTLGGYSKIGTLFDSPPTCEMKSESIKLGWGRLSFVERVYLTYFKKGGDPR